jgi:putative glutamine amidotransferase
MKKVGIIASYKKEDIDIINRVAFEYVSAVESVWWIPYIIPCNVKNIESYIKDMDLFIFPGGADIDPFLYHEENTWSRSIVSSNDAFLLKFLWEIIKSNKKILWICKWMQLINVFFNWTLIQDIENAKQHDQYERQNETIDSVETITWSFLEKAFGKTEIPINSLHHQAVGNIGIWLQIVARSTFDNTIEAIEHTSLPIYWVQWHPECLADHRPLFHWFIHS